MNNDRELLQQALDALDEACEIVGKSWAWRDEKGRAASNALRARLAQPDKPDYSKAGFGKPQREWVGLTDEEYEAMAEHYVTNCYFDTLEYARAIEAKLKGKNGFQE